MNSRRPRAATTGFHVVVMVKAARPGRVKTRLARGIGEVRATWLYRHMSASLLRRLMQSPCYRITLAVAPDREAGSAAWPRQLPRRPQGPGDLGQRMQRILDQMPPGPVLIVGTDIPEMTPQHLRDALRQLGRCEAVLGPAGDGGYWLIGMARSRRIPRPFADVRWSSEHALADTLAGLRGTTTALAATLADIDDAADLARWRRCRSRLLFRSG